MKKLNDMTTTDWDALISANYGLRRALYEVATDSAYFWIEEYLSGCKEDYLIGDRGEHFRIRNVDTFEQWLDGVQWAYCLLDEEAESIARKYIHYARIEEHLWYVYAKDKDIQNRV